MLAASTPDPIFSVTGHQDGDGYNGHQDFQRSHAEILNFRPKNPPPNAETGSMRANVVYTIGRG